MGTPGGLFSVNRDVYRTSNSPCKYNLDQLGVNMKIAIGILALAAFLVFSSAQIAAGYAGIEHGMGPVWALAKVGKLKARSSIAAKQIPGFIKRDRFMESPLFQPGLGQKDSHGRGYLHCRLFRSYWT